MVSLSFETSIDIFHYNLAPMIIWMDSKLKYHALLSEFKKKSTNEETRVNVNEPLSLILLNKFINYKHSTSHFKVNFVTSNEPSILCEKR